MKTDAAAAADVKDHAADAKGTVHHAAQQDRGQPPAGSGDLAGNDQHEATTRGPDLQRSDQQAGARVPEAPTK